MCFQLFVSLIEQKSPLESLEGPSWTIAMQEELNQFEKNKEWTLTNRVKNYPILGTKWVFSNELNKVGAVVRNKARLVANRYN